METPEGVNINFILKLHFFFQVLLFQFVGDMCYCHSDECNKSNCDPTHCDCAYSDPNNCHDHDDDETTTENAMDTTTTGNGSEKIGFSLAAVFLSMMFISCH